MIRPLILVSWLLSSLQASAQYEHEHTGTPLPGKNCGSNYMLPGHVARLGSHTFMLLGQDGEHHVLAAHRSGTPPHNYQFVLRFRLDDDEMALYKKLKAESKTLPAFTTIHYNENKEQLARTFFCLADLNKVFGDEQKKGDAFDKLFPIKGALLKDADHEGLFKILPNVVAGASFSLERKDVEIVINRYLPAYLPQKELRAHINKDAATAAAHFNDGPRSAGQNEAEAKEQASYIFSEGVAPLKGKRCAKDYHAPNITTRAATHTFALFAGQNKNELLALHLYDQAPQNFQSLVRLSVEDKAYNAFSEAKKSNPIPLLVSERFCMGELKKRTTLKGTLYRGDPSAPRLRGERVAAFNAKAKEVLVNRNLASLLNVSQVARDESGHSKTFAPVSFVNVRSFDESLRVEARYNTTDNFLGRRVDGYHENACYLAKEAAYALSKVNRELAKSGYGLLLFDCYRPQRAVNDFVKWARDLQDTKMKAAYYPNEIKRTLFKRGYIASKSGHSRGSTVDLTVVKLSDVGKARASFARENDCKPIRAIDKSGQLDMGTPYDCFSVASATASELVSAEARANRMILKKAMQKFGFRNYRKEWWHYTYKPEVFRKTYFDFEVR